MTASIRFYRDQSHLPRVQAGPEHAALADYLESDIQDTATADNVLAGLKKTTTSKQELSGNSYAVILNVDHVTLESLFGDQEALYTLPMPQFQYLLTAWKGFLDNDNLISIVPDF